MAITRREFLQYSAATGAGVLFGVFDLKPIVAYAGVYPVEFEVLTDSVCCYCGVGCGILVGTTGSTSTDKVTYVQGDPDNPINKGSLCSKGASMAQLRTVDGALLNPRRLTGIKYRRPNALDWDATEYGWTDIIPGVGKTPIQLIANRIKTSRDGANLHWTGSDPKSPTMNTTLEEWVVNPDNPLDGTWVKTNRCTGIANLGGAAHDTEECYLLVKLMRALGLVYIEHQARI
ncbi:MAG: twin-arginine translocation signal domain-containing protein [Nitrospirota bacterium]